MTTRKILLCLAAIASLAWTSSAQTVTVKDTVIKTYDFSDPDPVARTGRIYPYYKFQKFAFEGVEKSWKMVVLENDYLRVKIFPEIGGKVWSIFDKKEGKELFYDNAVIKFREIAMRGPWTSGGIEFNYGVIGHAPSCANPVDYRVENKADGSVSCYIGVQELLTRTRWMVEINLPKDAVWVRTRTFWHNYSGTFQPYYHWANSGITAADNMEFIYPATYSIAHSGNTTPYPHFEGHDLSRYDDQTFGQDKSLHPGGSHKGFFGAYWPDDDFGMLHYALRDEKLGRKYFSWAQSEQGSIWVDLLTDTNPQYVELQSGRLFNQNDGNSVRTPYKQFLFSPYGTDEWNEYWLPFAKIGAADDMTLRAVVNVEGQKIGIYPLQKLSGEMLVKDAEGKTILSRKVEMKPSEAVTETVSGTPALITIAGQRIWSSDTQETDRPHVINPDLGFSSAQGYVHRARYYAGQRNYKDAEVMVDSAIFEDPSIIEALDLKAMICYRSMRYQQAYDAANKALTIDEYDPQANYISGLTALKMGKLYDAMDRLELAAITSELRSAALTKLGEIRFVIGDKDIAADYARKSLVGNSYNMTALQLLYQCEPDSKTLDQIEALDPTGHFPAAERCLAGKISAKELYDSIFEEMKWQNYLEYASWYHSLGLDDKACALIEACPEKNALLAIWDAYLKGDAAAITAAENEAIDLVFPFREESYAPLKWAVDNGGKWQSRYLLAMLTDFLGDKDGALSLMDDDSSDYAPYYAYRATLTGAKADIEKAHALAPEEWRYIRDLALKCYDEGDYAQAIAITGPYYNSHKENFHVGDAYVKSLIAAGQYAKADKVMSTMKILPFEGQSGSHKMYREIKLALAGQCIDKKQYKKALSYVEEARLWPKRLGVGKPYDELIDTSEEDSLTELIKSKL